MKTVRSGVSTTWCALFACGASAVTADEDDTVQASKLTEARSADGDYIAWREHLVDDSLTTACSGSSRFAVPRR